MRSVYFAAHFVCVCRFVVVPFIRTLFIRSFKFQIKSSFQSDNFNKIKMRASVCSKNVSLNEPVYSEQQHTWAIAA